MLCLLKKGEQGADSIKTQHHHKRSKKGCRGPWPKPLLSHGLTQTHMHTRTHIHTTKRRCCPLQATLTTWWCCVFPLVIGICTGSRACQFSGSSSARSPARWASHLLLPLFTWPNIHGALLCSSPTLPKAPLPALLCTLQVGDTRGDICPCLSRIAPVYTRGLQVISSATPFQKGPSLDIKSRGPPTMLSFNFET